MHVFLLQCVLSYVFLSYFLTNHRDRLSFPTLRSSDLHVRIVALRGLVLPVRRFDRDAARLFLRRRINLIVVPRLPAILLGQYVRHRRRQRRLAVIHVPDRAHVHVRLGALEFAFCHVALLLLVLVVLVDDGVSHALGRLGVVLEFHRVGRPPLRQRAQRR